MRTFTRTSCIFRLGSVPDFLAQGEVLKSVYFTDKGLNLLDSKERPRQNRLNSTAEEAAELLLKLDPKSRKIIDAKSEVVNIEYPSLGQ